MNFPTAATVQDAHITSVSGRKPGHEMKVFIIKDLERRCSVTQLQSEPVSKALRVLKLMLFGR